MSADEIVDKLITGGIAVIPTDTVYGIVAKAMNAAAVGNLYAVRERDQNKPCIVLISSLSDLNLFSVILTSKQKEVLSAIWPGLFSVILPCAEKTLTYLHRGKNTLAFRLPANQKTLAIIKKTGPLVAPSANPQGKPIARNITEAKNYFGNKVNGYLDGGFCDGKPSTLLEFLGNKVKILRQGAGIIPNELIAPPKQNSKF